MIETSAIGLICSKKLDQTVFSHRLGHERAFATPPNQVGHRAVTRPKSGLKEKEGQLATSVPRWRPHRRASLAEEELTRNLLLTRARALPNCTGAHAVSTQGRRVPTLRKEGRCLHRNIKLETAKRERFHELYTSA